MWGSIGSMKGLFRGTGYTKPRPWKQTLGFHVRLSIIFNAERPCLVWPAPLVLEFPLFYGWVSSSEWTRSNAIFYFLGIKLLQRPEGVPHGAVSFGVPRPTVLGVRAQGPCSRSWQACRPAHSPICLFSKSQRARLCLCECVAYQHLGGGQHHSHPKTRDCSSDLP